jgi:peptidoglycan/xylan/chitin deacetylase (PgdA/CDA1 family)
MSFRSWAKAAISTAAERTYAHRLLGMRFAGAATIFTLHRVIRKDEIVLDRSLAVSEQFLDAVVRYVVVKGYEIITLEELWRRRNDLSMERRVVVFTFDDGYRDNETLASPIFAKHRVPWSLFITSGFPDQICNYWWGLLERALLDRKKFDLEIGGDGKSFTTASIAEKRAAFAEIADIGRIYSDELANYLIGRYGIDRSAVLAEHALSWAEIRQLAASGLVDVGAHTVTHPNLTSLSVEAVQQEMEDCRRRIVAETGITASSFAYPYGAAGPREYELARETGYKTAVTSVQRNVYFSLQEIPHAFPRIALDGRHESLSTLDAHLSGLTGLLSLRSKHPAWPRLSAPD